MEQKICVITGGNSGIGKEAAIQIAKHGHHVIIACRNKKRGLAAVEDIKEKSKTSNIELMMVDMSLQSSIEKFASTFKSSYPHLDVLIHNAAHFDIRQKKKQVTKENIEKVWATNHIGPVYLTTLLIDHVHNSDQGRIIMISSKGLIVYPFLKVNLHDPEFRHKKFSVQKAYYQSKLAQVMYTYWLADKLKETKITANAIRVTNVKIDLSRYSGLSPILKAIYKVKSSFSISPSEMANTYTYLALSDEVAKVSGAYFDSPKKRVKSSKYSRNPENITKVMEVTRKYISF